MSKVTHALEETGAQGRAVVDSLLALDGTALRTQRASTRSVRFKLLG